MNFLAKSKVSYGGSQALLAAAFLFATTNVLVREMASMWGDQAQVASRFALVWLILSIYAHFKSDQRSVPRAKTTTAVAYTVLAAIAILFFTLSVQMTTIANTLFTSNATELFVAFLIGTFFLREDLTKRKLFAIGLSLAGLVLYSDSLLNGDIGLIYGVLAGAIVAVCNLLAKKLKGVDLNAILRMQFGVGAVFMIGLTLLFSSDDIVRIISFEAILATVIFALVLIAATRLVLYGFQHSDINIASVVLSSQLAFGGLLGLLIYQEIPTKLEIFSGLLIVAAVIIGTGGGKSSLRDVPPHP